jgi:VanZ family protein
LTVIRVLWVTGLRVVTAGYAIALVVATHLPRLDVSFDLATPVPPDKFLHFAAYGMLGFLAGLVAVGTRFNWRRWFPYAWAAIALFALLDEATQPFFGRAAEPLDWVADVVGGAVGLGAAATLATAARVLMAYASSD